MSNSIYHLGHPVEHYRRIQKKAAFDYFEGTVGKKEALLEDSDLEEILEEDFWRVSYTKKVKNASKPKDKPVSTEQHIDESEAEKYGIDVEKFKNANTQ